MKILTVEEFRKEMLLAYDRAAVLVGVSGFSSGLKSLVVRLLGFYDGLCHLTMAYRSYTDLCEDVYYKHLYENNKEFSEVEFINRFLQTMVENEKRCRR